MPQINLPVPVDADFMKAVLVLHPEVLARPQLVSVSDHGSIGGVHQGFFLTVWDIDAPLPDAEQITAALSLANNEELRRRRAKLLAETDWTQMPDSPLSAEKMAEWATYRQALRDAPETGVIPDAPQT